MTSSTNCTRREFSQVLLAAGAAAAFPASAPCLGSRFERTAVPDFSGGMVAAQSAL